MIGLALTARPALAKFDWAGHVEVDAEDLLKSDDPKARLEAVRKLGNDDIRLSQR